MHTLTQRRGYVHILPRPPPKARQKAEGLPESLPGAPVCADVAESGIRSWFGTSWRETAVQVRSLPSAMDIEVIS